MEQSSSTPSVSAQHRDAALNPALDVALNVAAIAERVERLEQENRELRQRLDAPESEQPALGQSATPSVTRRRVMLGGAAAAIGAVAASAHASPAAAGDSSPVLRNLNNATFLPTGIGGAIAEGGPGGTDIFTAALNVSNSHPTTGSGMYAFGQNYGVAALGSGPGGSGVFGRSEAGGQGVHGWVYGDEPSTQFTAGVFAQSSYPESPAVLTDAPVAMRALGNADLPPADSVRAGDLSIRQIPGTTHGEWNVCVEEVDGPEPPRYVKVAVPGAAGAFVPLDTPTRAFDTRPGTPEANAKTPLVGGVSVTFDVSAATGGVVPIDASAVVFNLTVARGSARGFVAAFPGGAGYGGTSNLNFDTNQAIANQVTARLGDSATLSLQCGEAGITVDAIVDVMGYFA